MDINGLCGNGSACEQVCPFKMKGRLCPDTDDLAYAINVAYGIIPPPQAVPEAA